MKDEEDICKSVGMEVRVEYNKCPKCGSYSEDIPDKFLQSIACSSGEWYAKLKCTRCDVIWYYEYYRGEEKISYRPPKVIEIPLSELRPPSELLKILKDGQ
jgi:hypothetical protein